MLTEQQVVKKLNSYSHNNDHIWGVTIWSDQININYNADEIFPAASLIKIPILLETYRQVLDKKLNWQQTYELLPHHQVQGSGVLFAFTPNSLEKYSLRNLVTLMMPFSDNTATNIVLEQLEQANINDFLKKLGLTATQILATKIDPQKQHKNALLLGTTTPNDMTLLLKELFQQTILTPTDCESILTLMSLTNNARRLRGDLPFRNDLYIYHKTGTLGGTCHDVGLFRFNGGAYIISVLIKNINVAKNPRLVWKVEEQIADFSRWVFEQF